MRTNQRFSGHRGRNIDKKPIDIKGGKQLIFTIENTMINHGQDCSHFTVQAGKIVNSVLTDSKVQIVAAGSL